MPPKSTRRRLTFGSSVRVGVYTGTSVTSWPRAISSVASALSRKQLPQYIPAAPAVIERILTRHQSPVAVIRRAGPLNILVDRLGDRIGLAGNGERRERCSRVLGSKRRNRRELPRHRISDLARVTAGPHARAVDAATATVGEHALDDHVEIAFPV